MKVHAERLIISAVKDKCKDPESVEIQDMTGAWQGAGWWAEKYRIRAANSFGGKKEAYGYAKVVFKGGNYLDDKNWTIENAYIDEQ